MKFVSATILAHLFAVILWSPVAQSSEKLIYAVFWRGCEEACNGFRDYVTTNIESANIVIRDAESSKDKIPGFLAEARSMNADLILTWGTSVSLGIAGRLEDIGNDKFNSDIPHVFTVVADPVGVGLIESLDKTDRKNITGTFNRVPESVNIATIRSYMPSFKRLGLLFNANERNSLLKRDEIASLSKIMHFELIAIELELGADGNPNVEDIPVKIAELKEAGAEFIYLGSSSFLDTNRDVFTGSAVRHGIPVLSPYERLVRTSDALLSISARYYEVGKLAGQQARKILVDGVIPGEIPVARMTNFAYVINMDVAKRLNLFPPVDVLQIAETVKQVPAN